jgi:hypothetical protein
LHDPGRLIFFSIPLRYRSAVDALVRCNSVSGFCSAASAMSVSAALLALLGAFVAMLLA